METSALEEARAAVEGPRRTTYGHPLDNHSRTAAMWSAFLGIPITPEQVCWLNILQKASRNVNADHRDNVVDVIGYAANIDILKAERIRRAAE